MTANEALKILLDNTFCRKPYSCTEYSRYFVFQLSSDEKVLDSQIMVDKKTKKITAYDPLKIPIDEFNSGGKKIKFAQK